jgi:integrase
MATVRLRILPKSGKKVWQADFRDGAGKRRARQFDKKSDADAFLLTARIQVREGVHIPDSESSTVAVAANRWLTQCELEGLEESTTREYRRYVETAIRPALGAVRLSRLNRPTVSDFRRTLMDTYSHAMTGKIMTSLRALIDNAVADGLAGHNPVSASRQRRGKTRGRSQPRQKLRITIPSKDELRLMLERVEACGARWRPFLIVAMFSGLRASELRALAWDCVDLRAGTITVRQRADFRKRISDPKSEAGHREVPVGPFVVNTLREWMLRSLRSDRNLVFPTERGTVYGISKLRSLCWWPLMASCGLLLSGERGRYRFHDLRHVGASLWIEQGANPKRIQTLMGHSSIQQTYDTYGHLFADADRDRDAAQQIEARLLVCNTDATPSAISQ